LKIVQMDPLEIEFYVPENLVGGIHMGAKFNFPSRLFLKRNILLSFGLSVLQQILLHVM